MSIAASRRPPHSIHTRLQRADGGQIILFGEITLELEFDGFHTSQDVVVADLQEWGGILGLDFLREHGREMSMWDGWAAGDWVNNMCINQPVRQNTIAHVRLEQSVEIPPTMELVVTGIAENKLQHAGGSSALLTPSASLVS